MAKPTHHIAIARKRSQMRMYPLSCFYRDIVENTLILIGSNMADSRMMDTAKRAEGNVHSVESTVLQGKGWSDHPLHPSTVHFPIAFLSASFALYALDGFIDLKHSVFARTYLPPAHHMPIMAFYAGVAGILTAVPAILTGGSELYDMLRGQVKSKGLIKTLTDAADLNKTDVGSRKARIVISHAILNDAISFLAIWNWITMRSTPMLGLPKANLLPTALATPVLLYSAYLGGTLVYKFGFGVQRQGESAEIKAKMQKQS